MSHDNADEPTVKQQSHPWAVLEGDTPLFHVPGTYPPEYAPDAVLEPLWRAKRKTTMQPYYSDDKGIVLYHGDCLDVMPELAAQSFDAVITDVPFGSTDNQWDVVIPFEPMWEHLRRIAKRRAAIALFARGGFSFLLGTSNAKNYKHKWIWNKGLSGNFHLAKYQPLQVDEDILVFSYETAEYYPQMENGVLRYKGGHRGNRSMGGLKPFGKYLSNEYYPSNIIKFTPVRGGEHETQKPLALMEYLIRTYTNEGDTILDFTCGSGTTLRAAKNLKRRAVGIEQDRHYCDVTVKRLEPAFEAALVDDGSSLKDLPMFAPLFESEAA